MTEMAECRHNGYVAVNVYRNVTDAVRSEIAGLWLANNMLDPQEARRRVDEVVFIARAPDGALAGMTTAYLQDFRQTGNRYYFMRMFIRPEDRWNNGLRSFMSRQTRMFLAGFDAGEPAPKGVIVVLENRKIARRGMKRLMERLGYRFLEIGPRGNEVWCWEFDNISPQNSEAAIPEVDTPQPKVGL